MSYLPAKPAKDSGQSIHALEEQIAALEKELEALTSSLNQFETLLRTNLKEQIQRIRALTAIYKQHKQQKKAKRLEQKKRGKNYKEPVGLRKAGVLTHPAPLMPLDKQQQLKRLYKEAIVLVHPDKFLNEGADKAERANALTVTLNDLYQREDLEQLNYFHEHIISGNAMSHVPHQAASVVDPAALHSFLEKKKEELLERLAEIKKSQTYVVLNTYADPASFIEELRLQFSYRIQQLEKRTRKR